MQRTWVFCIISTATMAILPPMMAFGWPSADSIAPPPDYYVEEGIWIKEHGLPATAWGRYDNSSSCLNLSSPTAKLDLAYVIRSPDPGLAVAATCVLYRNSDTKVRFLDNGTLLPQTVANGCLATREDANEPVKPFWIGPLTKDREEYHQGYTYHLFLTTLDPSAHSGLFQIRINVTGIAGGSSWEQPDGNPRVPWIFFRVPSGAGTAVSPFRAGDLLRAASLSNVSGWGFPANWSVPSPYEIFIDCISWLNGSCYGGRFFRSGIEIPRTLYAGLHKLTAVCAETEASISFCTYEWQPQVQVSPNVTVPGGRAVCITGWGFPMNQSYSVYWGTVDNSTPILSGALSSFGTFSACFQFPRNASLGLQNITVTAPRVSGPPSATTQVMLDPWSVNLTVNPLKLRQAQGQWLDINGSNYPLGCRFRISVDGVGLYEGTADENGSFYYRAYSLDPLFNPGHHIVSADATDYSGSACGRVEIEVLQYDARISVQPNLTHPGTTITVDGQGFPPNDFVEVKLDAYTLGHLVSSPAGSFRLACEVPANFSLGPHLMRAYAPRYGGPPSGNCSLELVQWPIQVDLDEGAPHPGGWVKITGRGFPPRAAYKVCLNGSTILTAKTSPTGEFEEAPSLPLDIVFGTYQLEVLAPDYSGPPRATIVISVRDWSPLVRLQPLSPRPGEALRVLGTCYPRNCRYTIWLDGSFVGNGTTSPDGTFQPYVLLRTNVTIGTHVLNVTAWFPRLPPTAVEFSVEPWRLSLTLSPTFGPKGTPVKIKADGCPPLSKATIYWDGHQVKKANCSIAGSLVETVVLNFTSDEAYHEILVECEGYAGPPSVLGYFWLGTLPPTLDVFSCDLDMVPRSIFFANETVYARAIGLPPSTDAKLYLLNGSTPTSQGEPLPVHIDPRGGFAVKLLDKATSWGEFGLWLDLNRNGLLDGNDFLRESAFRCKPRPQLALAGLNITKPVATEGETLSIEVRVENNGKEPENASIHITYGSAEIAAAQIPLLGANSATTITVEWTPTTPSPGPLTLAARIDVAPGEIVTYDNQMEFGPVTIQPAPDISILSLTPDRRRARTGSLVAFEAIVKNSGLSFQTFTIQLVWGEEVVTSATLKLPAGGAVVQTLEWNTTGFNPGEKRILLRTAPIPFEKNPDDNQLASGTIAILPPNAPPNPSPGGPHQGISGIPSIFDGSPSSDDEGIVSYQWDFGDGFFATGAVVSHAYAAPGRYTVQLTVTDAEGASSSGITIAQIFSPLDVKVWSTDEWGRPQNEYRSDEGVYATVLSPALYNASLYVASHASQQHGQPLTDTSGEPEPLSMAGNVTILVCKGWLPAGLYDLVLDLNSNARFDQGFDPVSPSFLIVGEARSWLTTALAVAIIAAALRLRFDLAHSGATAQFRRRARECRTTVSLAYINHGSCDHGG